MVFTDRRSIARALFIVLVFGTLLNYSFVFAQVTPGGVTSRSAQMVYWLRADSVGCSTNGCAVSSNWLAKAGPNGNQFGTGTMNLNLAKMSSNPSLEMSSKWYRVLTNAGLDSAQTLFAVCKSSSTVAPANSNWHSQQGVIGGEYDGSGNNAFNLFFDNGEYGFGEKTSTNAARARVGPFSNRSVVVGIRKTDGGNDDQFFVNGSYTNFNDEGVGAGDLDSIYFGAYDNSSSEFPFIGEIAEIVVFRSKLTQQETERTSSYLALRHGITINHNYRQLNGSGGIVYTRGQGFDNRIFGIGHSDISAHDQRLQRSSQDTGLVVMHGTVVPNATAGTYGPRSNFGSSLTTIANEKYLTIGDNNGASTFTLPFGPLSNGRLGRTYRATDVGAVGAVTLWFKQVSFADLSNPGPFYLAVSGDSLFGMGEIFYPLTLVPGSTNDYYVTVDFPNNGNSFFTLVLDAPFVGPANVKKNLEFWVLPDSGLSGFPGTAITKWADYSGNTHDVNMSTPNGTSLGTVGNLINYHPMVSSVGTLDRNWATPRFQGQTIIGVGRVVGGAQHDGWLGFNGDKGLRRAAAGPANAQEISVLNTDDWCTPTGSMRANGLAAATATLTDFRLLMGERASVHSLNQFFLGGYFTGRGFDKYDFAEILVYDSLLTLVEKNRLESYLAIKYGITLGHDYSNSANGSIYTSGGTYQFDIFGIGRDDNGALNQKQSISIDTTSIVSMSLKTHKTTNNDNNEAFANDLQFLIAGSDTELSSSACWSSDLTVPGEEGEHVRIQRSWKAVSSNWDPADSVEFILLVDNANYDVPSLPAGADSVYYMYYDIGAGGPQFTTAEAYPMRTLAPGVFWVRLSGSKFVAPLATTSYFTFGTKLDSFPKVDSICAGDSIVFYRADLPTLSTVKVKFVSETGILTDSILLSNPTVDTTNFNCFSRISFPAPASLLPDTTYAIAMDDCGVGCLTYSFPGNLPVTLDSIAIRPGEDGLISFLFPPDSIFCANGNSLSPSYVPAPNAFGPGFGTFVLDSTTGSASLPALVDTVVGSPTFGMIVVHSGNVGYHRIIMKSRPNLTCPDSTIFSYEIKANVATTIAYDNSLYCGSVVTDTPDVTIGGLPVSLPTDGMFELFPPVVGGINDSMGSVIGPALPTFGSYIVTFRPNDTLCAADVSQSLTFSPSTRANFDYLASEVCVNSGTIGPFITSRPPGYFALDTTNSPGTPADITLNPTNGFIDLNNTNPNTFIIKYVVTSGSCPYESLDTIIVSPKPDVTIITPDTVLCNNASFIEVLTNSGTGTFHSWDNSLLISNDTISSNNVIGGPYDLYYTDTLGICADSNSIGITVIGLQLADIEYPSGSYCQNAGTPLPTFISGTTGGEFLLTPPIVGGIDSVSGMLFLSQITPGVYDVSYITPDSVCPDTNIVDVITVQTVNPATFDFPIDSVCEGLGGVDMDALYSTGGYQFTIWKGSTNVTTSFNIVHGAVTRVNFGALVPDSTITYIVRSIRTTGTCTDTAYADFTILRNSIADIEFIPPIICFGDADPYPFNYGDPNGLYTIIVPASGVGIDDSTGTVLISASATSDTLFTVVYTTPGSCSSTDTATVILRPKLDASFHYPDDAYCIGLDGLLVDAVEDSSAGVASVYSCQDTNLILNNSTGQINLVASQPGRYNVVREIQQTGACADSDVFTITLDAQDTTTRMYVDFNNNLAVMDTFCPSLDSIAVFLEGDSSGIFSSTTGLIYKNIDIGMISLRYSPTGVKHIVRYDLNNACGDVILDSLFLVNFENADFDYGTNSFCNGTGLYSPTFSTPGSFTIQASQGSTGSLVFSDGINGVSQTGTLDLTSTGTTGAFTVFHETTGACPGLDSVVINVFPQPTNADIRVDPATSLCIGQTATILPNGVATTYRFFLNDTTNFIQRTPSLTTSTLSDGDSIIVEFQSNNSCTLYKGVKFRVRPIPVDSILGFSTILSSADPIEIELMSLTDENLITWAASSSSTYTLDSILGFVPMLDSGEVHVISVTGSPDDDLTPCEVVFYISPGNGDCSGKIDTVRILINPNNSDVFIPQVITPDNNGKNDLWQIQFKNGVLPSDYRMTLYNEAGARVFEMSPVRSDWNGGGLPDGVYWYILSDLTGAMIEAGGLTIRSK